MMSWASIALTVLKIGRLLLQAASEKKQFDAGVEHASFEHAKAVLGMSVEGKRILEKINALSDGELDDLVDAVGGAGKR